MARERLEPSEINSDAQRCYVFLAKLTAAMLLPQTNEFCTKDLKRRVFEQSVDGPLGKCHRILDETINITSTDRGFRTNNHAVATYDQIKKGLLFCPKIFKESDENRTQTLSL